MAAIINLVAFSVFLGLGLGSSVAIPFAFLIAAIVNYLLCISILFRHKARWSGSGEITAYLVTLAIMGTLDYLITVGLVFIGLSVLWSKLWATVVGCVGNFILRKYFVF